MSRLQVSSKIQGDINMIDLDGVIDESFSFPLDKVDKFKLNIINLQNLKSINSTGIREWIKFHQNLTDTVFHFTHCHKFFIDQINMVKGFLPKNSKIISFYVPYFSEETDSEKVVLYREGHEFVGKNVKHPDLVLDEKNIPMEIDVMPDKYFKFLGLQL